MHNHGDLVCRCGAVGATQRQAQPIHHHGVFVLHSSESSRRHAKINSPPSLSKHRDERSNHRLSCWLLFVPLRCSSGFMQFEHKRIMSTQTYTHRGVIITKRGVIILLEPSIAGVIPQCRGGVILIGFLRWSN